MQEGTRDIQSAVKFRMSYTLVQREPRSPRDGDPLPNINHFPILNQQEAFKTFQATFEKDCGDNDVCESNMVTVANLNLPLGTSVFPPFGVVQSSELNFILFVTVC